MSSLPSFRYVEKDGKAISLQLERERDSGEWVVIYRENGKRIESMSYYTDDKADAISTLQAMAKEMQEGPCK